MGREEKVISAMALFLGSEANSTVTGLDDCRVKADDRTYKNLGKGITLCDAWLSAYAVYQKDKINLQELEIRRAIMPFVDVFNQHVKCESDRTKALEKIAQEFKEAKGGLVQIITGLKGNTMPSEDVIKKYEGFFDKISTVYISYANQRLSHVK